MYSSRVAAGFPSPADDYVERNLDFNEYLVRKPAATFVARAQGSSMVRLGILDQDLLVVDRSIEPRHGDVVIAAIDGEMLCKVLDQHRRRLLSGNDQFSPVNIGDDMELIIEGVVTYSIRHHHHVCTG
jgi:DNA polymerase V